MANEENPNLTEFVRRQIENEKYKKTRNWAGEMGVKNKTEIRDSALRKLKLKLPKTIKKLTASKLKIPKIKLPTKRLKLRPRQNIEAYYKATNTFGKGILSWR